MALDVGPDIEAIVSGLKLRDRRSVAAALSHLEQMSALAIKLLEILSPQLGKARIIGITGPPGAGKSTLVNALISPLRKRGRTLSVIAVDPSSPYSGGAILGDRLRMTAASDDASVFVRSLAANGSLGGINPSAVHMIDVFDAAGFDTVMIETVGTGQSEIDIAQIADVRIVVCAPGLGDHVQAMKSGLLEIADVLVVNKADCYGAEATRQQISGAVSVRTDTFARDTPVLMTTASSGAGVEGLIDTFEAILQTRMAVPSVDRRRNRARYLLARTAGDIVAARLKTLAPSAVDELADDLLAGRIGVEGAAMRLLAGPDQS